MVPDYFGMIGLFFFLFSLHVMFGAAGILLVLFVDRALLKASTVRFETYEVLYFLVPFLVLACLRSASDVGKSLSNLAEFLLIGLTIPLGMMIRIHLGKYIGPRLAFRVALAALSVVSFLIYMKMPALPE